MDLKNWLVKTWPAIVFSICIFSVAAVGHYFFWDHVVRFPQAGKIMAAVAIFSYVMFFVLLIHGIVKSMKEQKK